MNICLMKGKEGNEAQFRYSFIRFCLKHLKRGEGQELVEAGRKGYSGREYNATGSSCMQELWKWEDLSPNMPNVGY